MDRAPQMAAANTAVHAALNDLSRDGHDPQDLANVMMAYALNTMVETSDDDGEFKAWTPRLFLGADDLISPMNETIGAAVDRIEAEIGDLAGSPENAAVRVMEAQRAVRIEGYADAPAGVFCQLTTLRRDGSITTRILKRWSAA